MSSSTEDAVSHLTPRQRRRSSSEPLAGGGEAGALARSVDWATTPIGPVDSWSQALRSTASLVLHNHSGMLLWWGPEFVQIYNDAYRPVLGDKHPRAMGQRFRDCWSEVFHILGPMAERPFRGGPATTSDDIAVPINRKVVREESHFRLAYSPVPDDSVQPTGIGGVLATVTEITEQAYADRQIRTLRELGARSAAQGSTAAQACIVAASTLGENPWDVPFALFYLQDEAEQCLRLVASSGFDANAGETVAPRELPLSTKSAGDIWSILQVAATRQVEVISDLSTVREALPVSPWADASKAAIALPLASPEQAQVYGVLVCGLSPHRVLDTGYRTFFDLATAQIVNAIRNARALEEERKRAEALAEVDRAKTAFFSNVSHEFRTPLTLMLGPLEEAAVNHATPPAVRSQLNLAHRNALRLQKLVNSLLDFSRIEAGRIQASYEPTDLSALTRDLASNFHSAIEHASLEFTVECLPLAERVYVDREMWEKIVLNLLSNAFKFTLQGSIALRLRQLGRDAVLEVSDTGVGIPAHELPHIFERFHRVEGSEGRTHEGSGIGLALVQELVKLHHGSVSARSEHRQGATLEVRLPLGHAHLPADRIRVPRAQSSTATGAQAFVQEALRWLPESESTSDDPSQKLQGDSASAADHRFASTAGARIVLADDNADMRMHIRQLLCGRYVIEAVANGEEALAAARRERPDLILSDIMMPRLDGIGLLKALRRDQELRDVPLVLISARAGDEARADGLDAGADDYLIKPFSARELLARVGSLLELTHMRREAELALRDREEQLRLATEAAEVGFWDVDPVADTLFWPPRVRAMFGITTDAPVSMADFYAGLHPEDLGPTSAAFAAALDARQRARYDVEYRTIGKEDGVTRWVAAKGRGIFDSSGRCVRVIGAAIDITDRKLAEQRLQQETRSREILGNVSQALVAAQLDLERVVQTITDAATEISGAAFGAFFYNVQDQQGESYTLYTISGAPREAFARFPNPRNTAVFGPTFRGESVVRSADITADVRYGRSEPYRGMPQGHLPVRSYLAVPVQKISGEVLGGLFFGHPDTGVFDERAERLVCALGAQAAVAFENAILHKAAREEISERRRMEQQLDDANRRKDEFLAMLAHELRNPLAPIANASELLSRTLADDSRAQKSVSVIKRQITQLTRLVDDLLDVSRINEGRIQLRQQPIDLSSIVAQAVETAEPLLRERQHRLSMVVASYEPLYVNGDFARLVQCVGNILTNAIKYTDVGGEICIRTRGDPERVFVEVSDNGSGIASDLLPKIFDLFVQSERTLDRSGGGLGVGLAVVQRLIQMHHGEVSARSAGLGQGSTFEIRLPRIARPASTADAIAAVTATPRRILVVDDNVDAADSLAALLRMSHHDLRVTYNATEALACAREFRPEVGLVDLGLPGIDGFELARQLLEMPQLKGIRLIALSGYGQPEDLLRTQRAGFAGHLVKPVELAALERSVAGVGGTAQTDG